MATAALLDYCQAQGPTPCPTKGEGQGKVKSGQTKTPTPTPKWDLSYTLKSTHPSFIILHHSCRC